MAKATANATVESMEEVTALAMAATGIRRG